MTPTEVGTCEWLAEELAQARLLERDRVAEVARALREEEAFADANALADRLVRLRLLTPYQAKRAQDGDARKLVLGVYNLTDLLSPGCMGTVYRAAGRADRREYAVKVLPLRNQWNVRLVRKQVQAFEQLPPHDAVVPFVDVGTANGLHYLVWPFVEGRPLETVVLERGPLSAGEIASLGVQLAAGLQHCHDRKLAHGVLKPTNVMITPQGAARLLDFGVGALMAENSDDMESMVDTCSQAKVTAGLLECASPELVIDPTQLTPAGDQYSLGCVLYFCATGRYPFPGGTAIDKVIAHQKQRPTPVRSLNPDLPEPLVAVIERLMRKAPQDRYRRVNEVILDLEPFAGPGDEAPPPPVPVDVQTPLPKGPSRKAAASRPAPAAVPTSAAERSLPKPGLKPIAPPPPAPPRRRGLLSRLFFFWRG